MVILSVVKTLFSSKCVPVSRLMKMPTRSLFSKQLVYNQFGEPMDVVKITECEVPPLAETQVLVRMLAAPVNPADINTIQGKYPVKVTFPCIPGNEAVGVVEAIGSGVCGLSPGQRVIVTKPGMGTWRTLGTFEKDGVMVVPDEIGLVEAATLTVNPCTAYRMLKDFVPLSNGHVVIQNGANSACGQNVIQLCKAWNIKTVNIVRNRPEIDRLKEYLKSLGATYVLTEEELRTTTIFKDKSIDRPSLALNCVGGKSSLELSRNLKHSGKMVTYGGMSREPVVVPTASFIFKNLSFHGFWMTSWKATASAEETNQMFTDLIQLICEKKLVGPAHKVIDFDNYQEALANALAPNGFLGIKYLFQFQ